MTKRAELVVRLTVEYIPIPVERVSAWRAGLLLLLNLLYAEREIYRAEVANETKGFDRDRGVDRRIAPLPAVAIVDWKRTATPGGLRTWFIGHDGSVELVAYGSR